MIIEETTPIDGRALVDAGAFLLDVREADEWEAGHASAAQWIPLGALPDRLDEIPTGCRIVCICRSGGRSLHAAEHLVANGRDALNLIGGMRAWAEAGLDVVTGAGDPGTVI